MRVSLTLRSSQYDIGKNAKTERVLPINERMTLPVKRRKYDAPRIIKGPINQRKRPIVLDIRQGPIQPTDRSLIPTASASSIHSANHRAGNIVRAVGDSTTKLIQNMPPVSNEE